MASTFIAFLLHRKAAPHVGDGTNSAVPGAVFIMRLRFRLGSIAQQGGRVRPPWQCQKKAIWRSAARSAATAPLEGRRAGAPSGRQPNSAARMRACMREWPSGSKDGLERSNGMVIAPVVDWLAPSVTSLGLTLLPASCAGSILEFSAAPRETLVISRALDTGIKTIVSHSTHEFYCGLAMSRTCPLPAPSSATPISSRQRPSRT